MDKKGFRVGYPNTPVGSITPFNDHDITLIAIGLVELHTERPDLKVELFGVEFPDENQRQNVLVPFQKKLIQTFA